MGAKPSLLLESRELALSPTRAPLPPLLMKTLLGVRECMWGLGEVETCRQMCARMSIQSKETGDVEGKEGR